MSRWLDIARAARGHSGPPCHVPLVPLVPKAPLTGPNGTKDTNGTEERTLIQASHLALVPNLSEPEEIRVWLVERAAMRECSGASRVDADALAFDQLLWIWHAANPTEHAAGQCAACGTAFEPPVMSLPDGATVCDKPDHDCLISYGNGRRMEAVKALKSLGVAPPQWWEL